MSHRETESMQQEWLAADVGSEPAKLIVALLLVIPLFIWTLPQTLVGLAFAIYRRLQGHRFGLYRFGPFIYMVVPARGPASEAISFGMVIFTSSPSFLKHEFCHLITGLWLSWLYLPIYGIEYLLAGHSRSPHERITERLERSVQWKWRRWGFDRTGDRRHPNDSTG